MLKTAVVSPMPRPRATTATTECPGFLPSIRMPSRTSRQIDGIVLPLFQSSRERRRAPASRVVLLHSTRPGPRMLQAHEVVWRRHENRSSAPLPGPVRAGPPPPPPFGPALLFPLRAGLRHRDLHHGMGTGLGAERG